jgi:AcrR family transcriptional regulator
MSEAHTSTQARGSRLVQRVLEATLSQLAQVGYERLAIPEIADLVGANKTSLYRRWPTKLELVADALKLAMQHTEAAPDTGSLRGDLLALTRVMGEFTQSSLGTAVLRLVLAQDTHPELRELAAAAQQAGRDHGPWLVIQRALARGELSASSDPSLLLFTLAGGILHRVFVERVRVDDAYLQRLVDLLLLGAKPR